MSGFSKDKSIEHALATEMFVTNAERARRLAELTGLQQDLLDEEAQTDFNNSSMDDADDLSHGDDPVL